MGAAKALGRTRAAFDIVERAWELADSGCGRATPGAAAAARIRELFGCLNESCEE